MIEKVKDELSKGEIENALISLKEYTLSDTKTNNQVIVILGRYNHWRNSRIIGINDNDVELRKIEQSILEIINKFDKELVASNRHPEWYRKLSDIKFQVQISISVSIPSSIVILFFSLFFLYDLKGDGVGCSTMPNSYENPSSNVKYIILVLFFLTILISILFNRPKLLIVENRPKFRLRSLVVFYTAILTIGLLVSGNVAFLIIGILAFLVIFIIVLIGLSLVNLIVYIYFLINKKYNKLK